MKDEKTARRSFIVWNASKRVQIINMTQDETLIKQAVARDNAQFLKIESREVKGRKRVFVEFECNCGVVADKCSWTLVNQGGAFCKVCTQTTGQRKRQEAKSTRVLADPDLPLFLSDKDDNIAVTLNTCIELQVAPCYLRPVLVQNHTVGTYVGTEVRWWDFGTCTYKTKFMRSPEYKDEALALYEQKVQDTTGRDLIVSRSVEEILSRQAWYEKNFRLMDKTVEYADSPVVLDPYFLGVW